MDREKWRKGQTKLRKQSKKEVGFFFFKQKTAYEILSGLVGSEMCIRDGATGAGIIIRGGIAHGGPDAVIERPALNDVWQQARLDELLPTGMTRAELILRFTLSHPNIDTVIAGTCDTQHLQENIASASAGPLGEDLYTEIKQRVM